MSVAEPAIQVDTFGELQQLSTSELQRVDSFLYGDKPSISKVMRTIIELSAPERSWQGRDRAGALREFWYNLVKSIVQRTFLEHKDSDRVDQPFNDYIAGKLSYYLSQIVLDETNSITYRSLNILDDEGKQEIRTAGVESDKILFVEKDAAFRHLTPVAETYGFTLASGGGQANTAAIEDLANELRPGQEYELFVLSDFDPSGFGIIESFRERSEKLGIRINSVERVGINPEQVGDDVVQRQRFELPEKHVGWKHALGGRYGLEIEAFSGGDVGGKRLREAVVSELRAHTRTEKRYERDYQDTVRDVAKAAVQNLVSNFLEELSDELGEHAEEIVVELLTDIDGVTVDEEEEAIEALRTDLDTIGDGTPTVPDAADLHNAAIAGDGFEIDALYPTLALCGAAEEKADFEAVAADVGVGGDEEGGP